MTKTIIYTIQPKQIDDNGNELDLTQYTISDNANDFVQYLREIEVADKFITLPILENHKVIELISDQQIDFYIYDGVTEKIVFNNIKNLILNADLNYTYKIKNLGTDTANIEWRVFL
jgi:hypothetical protein